MNKLTRLALIAAFLGACQGAAPRPSTTQSIDDASATPRRSPSVTGTASAAKTPGAELSGTILFDRSDPATDAKPAFSVRPDGSRLRELEPTAPELMHLSPDGSLAVEMFLEGGHFAKILRPDGTLVRTLDLPDPALGLGCFAWSPDSTRLACEGWHDTNPERVGLYTVRASDGGDLRQLTAPADHHHDQEARYTPDGSQIWYIHSTDDTAETGQLWSVNVDGTDEHRLTSYTTGWSWSVSPDGRRLATVLNGNVAIFDAAHLFGAPAQREVPDGWAWDVDWSPDGSHFALMASMVDQGNRIATMTVDGTEFQLVPTGNGPGQVDLIGWRP